VSRRHQAALLRALLGLPQVRPTDETWQLIERWVPVAADKGYRFGLSDWLVAALASEIGGLGGSRVENFAGLERLKFVSRYVP